MRRVASLFVALAACNPCGDGDPFFAVSGFTTKADNHAMPRLTVRVRPMAYTGEGKTYEQGDVPYCTVAEVGGVVEVVDDTGVATTLASDAVGYVAGVPFAQHFRLRFDGDDVGAFTFTATWFELAVARTTDGGALVTWSPPTSGPSDYVYVRVTTPDDTIEAPFYRIGWDNTPYDSQETVPSTVFYKRGVYRITAKRAFTCSDCALDGAILHGDANGDIYAEGNGAGEDGAIEITDELTVN